MHLGGAARSPGLQARTARYCAESRRKSWVSVHLNTRRQTKGAVTAVQRVKTVHLPARLPGGAALGEPVSDGAC